jgi:hypothetical protein
MGALRSRVGTSMAAKQAPSMGKNKVKLPVISIIVEAHKFDILAVLIGYHMLAQRPTQEGRQSLGQIQTESELE